jgi:peroxisomal 2,4-dienoyl-CoA reductase
VVDGGAWRVSGADMGGYRYPDFLLSGDNVTGVKSGRKAKL